MKRILAGLFAALLSVSAWAITYNNPKLLDPTGSISGQVITSTGPTTSPGWATVTLSGLGGLAAANNLSDVASASTALANLGGLSSATAATTYGAKASPLSQFAATTSAQLASVISDETGTGAAVFGTSPTITTPNIVGVTTGACAAAGSVGECKSATGTAVSMTTGTGTNCASIPLTAGNWLVAGTIAFVPNTTTTYGTVVVNLSTTTGSVGTLGSGTRNSLQGSGTAFNAGQSQELSTPVVPINVSSAATAFLVGYATFATSTMTQTCSMWALRVH